VRALVQTVSRASVTVGDEVVGKISDGLLVLLGVTHDDTPALAAELARKTFELRILDGEGPRTVLREL
jgi:D-aminoacyl-tRNA deacylase